MLKKYSYQVVSLFFFLHLVDAILKLFNVDFQFDKILDISIIIIVFSIKNFEFKNIDLFVILYLVFSLFTILINQYPNQLILSYYAIKNTWITILLFFVGQNAFFLKKSVYSNMVIPITFSLVCGMFFFLTQPSWYVAYKSVNLDIYANEETTNEIFRMSSFWPSPQFLGYSNFIFFTYVFYRKYILQNLNNYIFLILTFISMVSALFIQIRVAIAFIIISFLTYAFWDYKYNKLKNIKNSLIVFVVIILTIITIFFVFNFSNNQYFLEKINSILNIQSTTNQRINSQLETESIFNKYEISMFGYGLGRFSISAANFKMPDLRDGGFLHEIMETGLIGFSILLMIVYLTFLRLFSFFKLLVFEFIVFAFYIGASLGSNALSEFWLVNGIFWLNLGFIWNKNILNFNKKLLKI